MSYFGDKNGKRLPDDVQNKFDISDATNLLVITLIHCIAGFKFSERHVCTREVYQPDMWKLFLFPCIASFASSFYSRHGVTNIYLRYFPNTREYTWMMKCTNSEEYKHYFFYTNNVLTHLVFKSLINIIQKEMRNGCTDKLIQQLSITKRSFGKFVIDTFFTIEEYVFEASNKHLDANLYLMMLVFYDTSPFVKIGPTMYEKKMTICCAEISAKIGYGVCDISRDGEEISNYHIQMRQIMSNYLGLKYTDTCSSSVEILPQSVSDNNDGKNSENHKTQ